MTIKEASRVTGVSIDNLRYYERIGLIPEVKRNSAGVREYDEATISMIELIMRFKNSGMKLESIRKYVSLAMEGEETAEERKKILIEAKENLEAQLIKIRSSLDMINYKIDNYEQKCGPVTDNMIKEWKASRSD